jgi:multiple sugar transport system substrate-binding protein
MFNEKYPNIKVVLPENIDSDAGPFMTNLQSSLVAGSGAPDVCLIEEKYIGTYKDMGFLENLLEAPYNAGKLQKDFVSYKWNAAIPTNGQGLMGMTWDSGPCGFFYNAVMFEQAGLPTEPEEVEAYLRTWDGFYDACEKIHALGDDKWLIASAADVFQWLWLGRDYYVFDEAEGPVFNFEQKPRFNEFLENAMKIRNEKLDANKRLWIDDELYTYFDQQNVAGIAVGSWMGGFFKSWMAPSQGGNFRICNLPLGLGYANMGGSYLAIPSQSKNKEAAWAFIEFALATKEAQNKIFELTDIFPAYIPAWDDPLYDEPDPYFGGQMSRRFFADAAAKVTPPPFPAPMDDAVEWNIVSYFNDGMANGLAKDDLVQFIKDGILMEAQETTANFIDTLKEAGIMQ